MTFKVLKAKLGSMKRDTTALLMSQEMLVTRGEGQASMGTLGTQSNWGTRRNINTRTPLLAPVRSKLASSFAKNQKEKN